MFTGIIEEIGKIKSIQPIVDGIKLTISASLIFKELKPGDSVSVNGICLTVKHINKSTFTTEAVGDTLIKTNISRLKLYEDVNLERALKLSDRLGGHIVQGHINAMAVIIEIIKKGDNYSFIFEIPTRIAKYVVDEGSITVEGISLTVASILENRITISVIPFTFQNTTLKNKKPNDVVNIETDIIAKYIENFSRAKKEDKLSENWLQNLGF